MGLVFDQVLELVNQLGLLASRFFASVLYTEDTVEKLVSGSELCSVKHDAKLS